MAKDQSRRLKPSILQADESGYSALRTIKSYTSINPTFSLDAITGARTTMADRRKIEAEAHVAAATARVAAVEAEWDFHNLMLGVKAQVIAQFGLDSDELAALGRKKKSDYKLPGRKPGKK